MARSLVRCALGILAAAVLFELGLRPFVAGWNVPEGPIRTVRSYEEGFSVAHFEPDGFGTFGNRLTGNPPLAGAPEGLIIGDSHVVAQGVRDEETMGAVIERLARTAGRPVNVRQYGWSSANAPTFLATAGDLMRTRHPAWVVVLLNSYSLGAGALTTTQNWRMEMHPDGSYRLIDMRPPPPGRMQLLRRELGRSALALALWRRSGIGRFGSIETAEINPGDDARILRATVIGLQQSYGTRLLIVYMPMFFGLDYQSLDPIEQDLARLCGENGVAYLSLRAALVRQRYEQFQLSRGFHNTAPGHGHFNAAGHSAAGTAIWGYFSEHPWRSSR